MGYIQTRSTTPSDTSLEVLNKVVPLLSIYLSCQKTNFPKRREEKGKNKKKKKKAIKKKNVGPWSIC